MFCSQCESQTDPPARFCGKCGNSLQGTAQDLPLQQPRTIVVRSGKNAGLAAILSFFWCGLGQIYNGQLGKGIALVFAYLVSIAMMSILIGFFTTLVMWIWGIFDAYQTAERLNREALTG